MPSTPIYVLDFEGSTTSGIVEYGVVTLKDGEITETETRYCGPRGPVSDREIRTHGLDTVELNRFPPFEESWSQFSAWRKAGPFAAHHASVENRLIKSHWPFCSSAPDFSEADPANHISPDWGPWIDSLCVARRLWPELEGYSLNEVIAALNLQGELGETAHEHCPTGRRHYHCALYDALASALILKHAFAAVREEEPVALIRWAIQVSQPGGVPSADQLDLFGTG